MNRAKHLPYIKHYHLPYIKHYSGAVLWNSKKHWNGAHVARAHRDDSDD